MRGGRKKGKRETEAVRGMHLNSSQHPFILPSPLLYLHDASCTERRKKKNSCSFFGIRNPGCTWKNALPIISPPIPSFFFFFLPFSLFFDCLARDRGQRPPPFCPRAPPFPGALVNPLFFVRTNLARGWDLPGTVNHCDSTCLARDNGEFTTELR